MVSPQEECICHRHSCQEDAVTDHVRDPSETCNLNVYFVNLEVPWIVVIKGFDSSFWGSIWIFFVVGDVFDPPLYC